MSYDGFIIQLLSMTNYVFIGDVHSQYSKFSAAVDWIVRNVENYHIIQGGDLFDSRNEESDSLRVYNLVKLLDDNITVLHSNHHIKLYKILTQENNNMQNLESLMRTVSDFGFDTNEELKNEVVDWLSNLPYGVAFKDSNGLEYRACHAYWYKKLYVPHEYEGLYKIHEVSAKAKGQMLYGISRRGPDNTNERILWWNTANDSYQGEKESFVRVSFHYHTVSLDLEGKSGRPHLILDGSCGDVGGQLMVYDVSRAQCVAF